MDDPEVVLWAAEADRLPLYADASEIYDVLARAPEAARDTPAFLYLAGFADGQDSFLSHVGSDAPGPWGQGIRDWTSLSGAFAPVQ